MKIENPPIEFAVWKNRHHRYLAFKSIADRIVAALALCLLFVPMALICLCNLIILGRPIFFLQERAGKQGKPFHIFKLRTMHNLTDKSGKALPDSQRVSKYGLVIRNLSLDELPGLLNVLRGDMSLVGPRPLYIRYIDFYSPEQNMRHWVKPGITGLAQVSGRNAISWDDKLRFDTQYVTNVCLREDLKILFKTVKVVVTKENNTDENSVVGMQPFDEYVLQQKQLEDVSTR